MAGVKVSSTFHASRSQLTIAVYTNPRMEPVSAIGIAATSLAFLDFAIKTVRLAKEVHDNAGGSSDANQELDEKIDAINTIHEELSSAILDTNAIGTQIMKISEECIDLGDQLKTILTHLKSSTNGSLLRVTFRAMRKAKTIEKLQARLEQRQKFLEFAISADIRRQVELILSQQAESRNSHALGLLQFWTQVQQTKSDISVLRLQSRDQHLESTTLVRWFQRENTASHTEAEKQLSATAIGSQTMHYVTHERLIQCHDNLMSLRATTNCIFDQLQAWPASISTSILHSPSVVDHSGSGLEFSICTQKVHEGTQYLYLGIKTGSTCKLFTIRADLFQTDYDLLCAIGDASVSNKSTISRSLSLHQVSCIWSCRVSEHLITSLRVRDA